MCDKAPEDDRPRATRPNRVQDEGARPMTAQAYRPLTHLALRERAAELRREADGMDRLAQVAEALLDGDPADGALWALLHRSARR